MIRLIAPAGSTNVSYGGECFNVGANGVIEVPDGAEATLRDFGFVPAPAQAETAAQVPAKPLTKAELKAQAQVQAEAQAETAAQ